MAAGHGVDRRGPGGRPANVHVHLGSATLLLCYTATACSACMYAHSPSRWAHTCATRRRPEVVVVRAALRIAGDRTHSSRFRANGLAPRIRAQCISACMHMCTRHARSIVLASWMPDAAVLYCYCYARLVIEGDRARGCWFPT
jgi:hypothetical protein